MLLRINFNTFSVPKLQNSGCPEPFLVATTSPHPPPSHHIILPYQLSCLPNKCHKCDVLTRNFIRINREPKGNWRVFTLNHKPGSHQYSGTIPSWSPMFLADFGHSRLTEPRLLSRYRQPSPTRWTAHQSVPVGSCTSLVNSDRWDLPGTGKVCKNRK